MFANWKNVEDIPVSICITIRIQTQQFWYLSVKQLRIRKTNLNFWTFTREGGQIRFQA